MNILLSIFMFTLVVSFCHEQSMELNSPITLDAYQPSFGASASFCMCEVKILSTQTFSRLRVSQESTLVPPENCGLQIKIENATQTIRTVEKCSYVGDTEYILYQGSSIVISLAKMSETWLEGFCFHLSIRFGKYIALNNSFINFFTDILNKEQMMICYGISVLICACKNTKKTWTIKKKKSSI